MYKCDISTITNNNKYKFVNKSVVQNIFKIHEYVYQYYFMLKTALYLISNGRDFLINIDIILLL